MSGTKLFKPFCRAHPFAPEFAAEPSIFLNEWRLYPNMLRKIWEIGKKVYSEVHPKCLDSLYLRKVRWWNINIHVTESKQLSVRSPRAWGLFLLLTQGQLSVFFAS